MLYFKLMRHLLSDIKSFKIDQILAKRWDATEARFLEAERNFWKWLLRELCLESKADLTHFPEACFILRKQALPGRYSSSEKIIQLQKCCLTVSPRLALQRKWWRRCQQHPGTLARCRGLQKHSSKAPKLPYPIGVLRASSLGPNPRPTDFRHITSIWSNSTDFSEIPDACNNAAKKQALAVPDSLQSLWEEGKHTNVFSNTGGSK